MRYRVRYRYPVQVPVPDIPVSKRAVSGPMAKPEAASCWACGVAHARIVYVSCDGDQRGIYDAPHCEHCGATAPVDNVNRGVFDECCLRGPCRALGRYGRATSLCTMATIAFCIVQNWRFLLPALVECVGSTSWLAAFLQCLAVYLSILTPFNYAMTVVTSPGYATGDVARNLMIAPARRRTLRDGDDNALLACDDDRQLLRGWRRCAETGLAMPPRSHYCRRCQRVVLRMDHHCAFVNTCVGHQNHHYFLRMLAFASASTCIESWCCLVLLLKDEALALALRWHLGVLCVVAGGACCFCTGLLGMQALCVSNGLTFIEWQRSSGSGLDGQPIEHDLGSISANCGSVLGCGGAALVRHLLPLPCSAVGDGILFAQRRRA